MNMIQYAEQNAIKFLDIVIHIYWYWGMLKYTIPSVSDIFMQVVSKDEKTETLWLEISNGMCAVVVVERETTANKSLRNRVLFT